MRRHRSIIAVLLCMIALFSISTHAKNNGNNNNKRDKRDDTTRTTNGKREKDEDTSKRDDKRNARNNNNPKNIVEELIIPRSVTRTFPICKRYANQNRQRLLIKGTETKSSSLLVGSSLGVRGGSEGEEEERILRRRQGNPMKVTNPNKANTSRTGRGQQQSPQRGNNAIKKRQQKRTNARQRKKNKQRNSNGRGTGRLQNNNRQYKKMNQRNSGGFDTKKQSVMALNWFGDEDTSSSSKPALKARRKKREANVKRVRKPTNTKPSDKEPTKTPKQMQMGQGYKPNYGYYPDFDNDICISDESYPNYMKTDVEFYFSTTINECCRLHYKGSVKDCLDVSMKVAKKAEWKEPQGWGKAAMPKGWGE